MMKKKWIVAVVMAGALTTVAGTAAYATSTSTTSPSTKQANHMNHEHKGFAGETSYLLSVLKVDQATLGKDLKSGMSLADIASKNGVSEQAVIDAVVTHEKAGIEKAVTAGKVTRAQADHKEGNLSAQAKKMVETKGLHGEFKGHHRGGFEFGPKNDSALLSVLKVDQNTLNQDRKSGLSLADIASKNGVSEQAVIDAIVTHEKAGIEKAVTAGKVTRAQADQKEANLSAQAKKMVEAKGFKGHKHSDKQEQQSSTNSPATQSTQATQE